MEKCYIYKLIDPITNKVRYVGKTKNKLNVRLSQHISKSKTNYKSHVYDWIRKLQCSGNKPIIELIEECFENNWEEREIYWISQFKNLTNISRGGITYFGEYHKKENVKKPTVKRILQYDLDGNFIKEYSSITEASIITKSNRKCINKCCRNKMKSTNNFQWKYYSKNYKLKIEKYKKELTNLFKKGHSLNKGKTLTKQTKKKLSEKKKIKVKNIKTNEIYNSIEEAANILNVNYKTLLSKLRMNSPSCPVVYINKTIENKRPVKKVKVIDTRSGIIYNSITDCTKDLDITRGKIRQLIKKGIIKKYEK